MWTGVVVGDGYTLFANSRFPYYSIISWYFLEGVHEGFTSRHFNFDVFNPFESAVSNDPGFDLSRVHCQFPYNYSQANQDHSKPTRLEIKYNRLGLLSLRSWNSEYFNRVLEIGRRLLVAN